ncbi:hypothetical protein C7S15_5332 [Burkholderia cepacia]|nr:hypothetical protein [Burkholderia cepacia]
MCRYPDDLACGVAVARQARDLRGAHVIAAPAARAGIIAAGPPLRPAANNIAIRHPASRGIS